MVANFLRGFFRSGSITNPLFSQAAPFAVPQLRHGIGVIASWPELLNTFDGYYYNTIFEQLGPAAFDFVVAMDIEDIKPRGIYNPVPVIVDFYAKHVLTGRMTTGPDPNRAPGEDPDAAIPDGDLWVEAENQAILEPIKRLWEWSNLQTRMSEISTNCANYGNCLLVVNDDPNPNPESFVDGPSLGHKVFIEVRHPRELMDYRVDPRGHFTYVRLESTERRPVQDPLYAFGTDQPYTWTRIYTPEEFICLENQQVVSRVPNPHGFIPVVLVKHKSMSHEDLGINAYAHALPIIHELCIQASILGTLIAQHVNPQWAIFGAQAPEGGLDRDGKVWFLPEGTSMEVVLAKLDIAGVYQHIERLLAELEVFFPELKLAKVGDQKRDVSGAAIRGILTGLIRKALDAREKYENGLKDAIRMALSMGSNFGGTGFNIWGEDLGTYEDGDFGFEFHWPDILPLNRLERLQLAAQEKAYELQIATLELQIQATQLGGIAGAQGAGVIPPIAPNPAVPNPAVAPVPTEPVSTTKQP